MTQAPQKNETKPTKPVAEEDDTPAYQEMVLFYLATGIKTLLIGWCILIISLAYIKLPDMKWWVADQRIDATYAAGVLGGLLGSLGVTVSQGKKKEDKNGGVTKKELESLMAAQNYQVIRVETPLVLQEGATVVKTTDDKKE